jgi:hypothetical protein
VLEGDFSTVSLNEALEATLDGTWRTGDEVLDRIGERQRLALEDQTLTRSVGRRRVFLRGGHLSDDGLPRVARALDSAGVFAAARTFTASTIRPRG